MCLKMILYTLNIRLQIVTNILILAFSTGRQLIAPGAIKSSLLKTYDQSKMCYELGFYL